MKSVRFTLHAVWLALLGLFATNASAQYCASGASTTYDSKCDRTYIEGNTLTLDNVSNASTCETYSDFTSFVAVDLTAGSDYAIALTNGTCGGNYTRYGNVWIDYNGNGTFETSEMLGTGTTGNSTNGYVHNISFTVPCTAKNGNTRMRVILKEGVNNNPCGSYTYGETEDYTVSISVNSTLAAGFFVVDTAFIKTAVTFRNANQTGYIYHGWDLGDDGSIEATTTDFVQTFTTPGKYCVRLYSENCAGRDSVINCVEIVAPSGPPVADFVSDKSSVELYNEFQLTDLSTNGAIYWEWFLFIKEDSANTRIDCTSNPDLCGSYSNNQNPVIFSAKGVPGYPDVGCWSVGLISSNDSGQSVEVVKYDYVCVEKGCDVEMGPGTVTGVPGNVITCTAGTLKNKDNGSGNYSTPEANLDALIAPCGAEEITFTFDQWIVQSNANLKVYDGQDASGIPLFTKNGFTATDTPSGPLVAQSGAMYFLWNTTGTATDKGFLGHWTSKIGTQNPPVADFSVADELFNAVENTFTNTSLNATGEVFYTWEIDGSTVSTSKDLIYTFLSNANYSVCLTVETCAGKNKSCQTVKVSPITSQANLDFTADERRPKAGDLVEFMATSDKANSFKWDFFPSNAVSYKSGTNANSKNPVVSFSAPGKYTVSLKGWNNLSASDSAISAAQVIKADYVIVISYCTPIIGVTTGDDFSTVNVKLENTDVPSKVLLENASGTSAYSDYTEEFPGPKLTFGSEYKITLERPTAANPLNRKVWIDYNIDGDFDDQGELVYNEATSTNLVGSGMFTIPDLANSFEGKTRMRIGTSYNTDPNHPCGASSGIKNANRIGEFEDYAIELANDNTIPVITLMGDDTAYVELGKTYADAGATAMDPTEGDISWRMDVSSDVDNTAAGIYYVTYNVEDASGNMAAPVTRVVIVVVDQSAPVITLNDGTNTGDATVYVDVITGTFTDPGATASDATDGNLTSAIVVSGTVNTFKIGTYVLTYTVQDVQGNVATARRNVIVQDNVFPTITNDEIKVDNGRNVVEVQLQSVFVDRTVPADNYNNGTFGPMFNYVITPANAQGEADVDTRQKGTTTVTYVATDESGNETTLVIDYVVEDYIAPVISLNTLDTVYHPVNAKYTPVKASASDNFYDNTQVSLVLESNVITWKLGLYTDTYTATDASGNVTVKNRYVRVYDGEAPKVTGKFGPIVRLGLFSQVSLIDYLNMTDNYDRPADLFANATVVSNDMNVYEEGTYAATFITHDNSGNESAPYTLLIIVDRKYDRVSNGVNDLSENAFRVYPNPNAGIFNVELNTVGTEQVEMGVYDMTGNKVAELNSNGLNQQVYTVDMSGHAAGVYFVRVMIDGAEYNQRVVVQ